MNMHNLPRYVLIAVGVLLMSTLLIGLCTQTSRPNGSRRVLDSLFLRAGLDEYALVEENENIIDKMIYQENEMQVWLRMQSGNVRLKQDPADRDLDVAFIFADSRLLHVLPVDVTEPPYSPAVVCYPNGIRILVTYSFENLENVGIAKYKFSAIRLGRLEVHSVYNETFEPASMKDNGKALSRTFFVADTLANSIPGFRKLVWSRLSGSGAAMEVQEQIRMVQTFAWNQASGRFELQQ